MNAFHLLPVPLLLAACSPEQSFQGIRLDAIAVTAGDFDRMEEALIRADTAYQLYEGYISGPVYDHSIDPDTMTLKVERLLGDEEELGLYGALFVNSGTRGLGLLRYDGLEADDELLSDPELPDRLRAFVSRGGVLLVSDWAYDLVELCWPEAVEWVGDDATPDDAQRGLRGQVAARVEDPALQDALGGDGLGVTYDYSYWAVPESVSSEVHVLLRGDVSYRASESEGDAELQDVPLLLSFSYGSGLVVYSSFHWRAQSPGAVDALLAALVPGLGNGAPADTGAGDTGSAP